MLLLFLSFFQESGNVRDTVSMTVEERLKSLLSGPTLGGSTEQRVRVVSFLKWPQILAITLDK